MESQHFLEPLGNEAETLLSHLSIDVACLAFCVFSWGCFKLRARLLKQHVNVVTKVVTASEPVPRKSAPKVSPLEELLSCTDRQRSRTLDVYQKYRNRVDWTSLAPVDLEKAFFNFCMAASRQGEMDALEKIFHDMDQAGIRRTTDLYTNLCKMITSKRLFEEALALWEWIRKDQIEVDRSTWSCLLFAATQVKENDLALKFFERLRRTDSAQAADYGNACRVLVSTSRVLEAVLLVREMQERNIEPYKVTYQLVFPACCANGSYLDDAVEMVDHMRRLPDCCDSVMYNVLIKGHMQANRFDDALNWFAAMKNDGVAPSSVSFGILLDACIEQGKLDKAFQIFKQMQSTGIKMNTILFTSMIKGFAKAGRVRDALQLYESMLSQDVQPDLFTYSTIIKVLCDNKELESAFLLLDQMSKQNVSPDEVVFNNLLAGCIHCSNLSLGEQLIQDMMKLGIKPSMATMSILLKLYARCEAFPKILELLQSMRTRFDVLPEQRLYVQVINSCLSVRRGHQALETIGVMRNLFGMPSEADVTKFLRLGVQFKLPEECVQIVNLALRDGVHVNADILDNVMEMASKHHSKAAIQSLTELAQKYSIRLRPLAKQA